MLFGQDATQMKPLTRLNAYGNGLSTNTLDIAVVQAETTIALIMHTPHGRRCSVSDELRLHEMTYAEIAKMLGELTAELAEKRERIIGLMSELERVQKELANRYV